MSNSKITTIILTSIIILFIALFALFFFSIYTDYAKTELVEKPILISEITGEIKPISVPKDNEEKVILQINPNVISDKEETMLSDDKFYYNQLDKYSKMIYKSLEKNKGTIKKGNTIIELPDLISEIIENNNLESIFSIAVNAFEHDNPDVFYLDNSKLILYYERDSLGNYTIFLKPDNQANNYLSEGFNNKQEIEKAENEIENIVNEIKDKTNEMSTENKIRYVHNWLVSNIKYDETLTKTNKNNIYGALVEKEAVCSGYAKAFKYIVDKLNINCIIVEGTATSDTGTENHAWNYIKLDDKWYGVDCTWDDPIIIGGNVNETNKIHYTYYLKGQNVFNKSHKPFETFYSTNVEINYPKLEQNEF